jgi:glutamine---fructose-6-phosphate transaminase (isomerizing)
MLESHLRKEIFEQPESLRRLLTRESQNMQKIADVIRQRQSRYVMMVARGSSDNAARYGQYLLGSFNALPVALSTPSLYTLYKRPPRIEQNALMISISQSGQSPDIVAVMEEGRRQGALTVAIVNNTDSPMARAVEHVIPMQAGPELSTAATKSYTASLMSVAMLNAYLSQEDSLIKALDSVPDYAAQVISDYAENTIKSAERYRYARNCVVLSRGYNYATAFEVALKLKEMTYVLAEPYSTSDFKHGPVALIDEGFPVIVIAPEGEVAPEIVEYLPQLRQHGAELIVISAIKQALSQAQTPLPLPAGMPEWLSPIIAVIQGQLFAMGLVQAKGYDPDRPRSISKVTLTT